MQDYLGILSKISPGMSYEISSAIPTGFSSIIPPGTLSENSSLIPHGIPRGIRTGIHPRFLEVFF